MRFLYNPLFFLATPIELICLCKYQRGFLVKLVVYTLSFNSVQAKSKALFFCSWYNPILSSLAISSFRLLIVFSKFLF